MTIHRRLSTACFTSALFFAGGSAAAFGQATAPVPTWVPAARMLAERVDHCAISLDDGRILVAGGTGSSGALSSVEIYGPRNEFQAAPAMSQPRAGHSCTKLADGRILVNGGAAEGGAEIFNPITSEWLPIQGRAAARTGHTANLLPDGSVLFAGGLAGNQPSNLLEIFNPATESITEASAALLERRARHTAVTLSDGRVFITGGSNGQQVLNTSEIYDPVTQSVRPAAPLFLPRADHGAALLPDGRVVIIGGTDGSNELGNGELYFPSDDHMDWIAAGMAHSRRNAFITLIPGTGVVLIAGGEYGGKAIATTELFEQWSDTFREVGSLTAPRTRIAGSAISEGFIFATGGRNENGISAACGSLVGPSLILSAPSGGSFQTIGLRTDPASSSLAFTPGQNIRANGSGWASSSAVALSLRRPDGSSLDNRLLAAAAPVDLSGRFATDIIAITASDIGSRVIVRATGSAAVAIVDGSSNTIVVGETGSLSTREQAFDVKAPSMVTARALVSTVVAGSPIPIEVTLNSPVNVGAMTGTVSVRIGSTTASFPILGNTPPSTIPLTFCCVTTPGSYAIGVGYSGDSNYIGIPMLIPIEPALTVVTNQVSLALSPAGFSLFTDTPAIMRVHAAAGTVPSPTGTVTIANVAAQHPFSATLALSRDLRSAVTNSIAGFATFNFKATFADKPNTCLNVSYSGDSVYAPLTNQIICVPTNPAVPKLEIIAPSATYTFGTPFPVTLRLTFPPELGLVNRSVRLSPPGADINLQVAVGSAQTTAQLLLPFATEAISATYSGGGDLALARALFSVKMLPAATETKLDITPVPPRNPLTLRVLVSSVVPVGKTSTGTIPVPSGTVQFFDGDLFLGQAQTANNADGTTGATLTNVSRPVGKRGLRAVYSGNAQFAGSTSPTVVIALATI